MIRSIDKQAVVQSEGCWALPVVLRKDATYVIVRIVVCVSSLHSISLRNTVAPCNLPQTITSEIVFQDIQ